MTGFITGNRYRRLYTDIKFFLLAASSEVSYYELFKRTSVYLPSSEGYYEDIYLKNFVIRHLLYDLQFELYRDFSWYLGIETDSLQITKIPSTDTRFFFSRYRGSFLDLPGSSDTRELTTNPLREYYSDLGQLETITDSKVRAAVDAAFLVAFGENDLAGELEPFGLNPGNFTRERLDAAYRRMVKELHPDTAPAHSSFQPIDEKSDQLIHLNEKYKRLRSFFI